MSNKNEKELFKELFKEVKADKEWEKEWKDMPEFIQEDLTSYRKIIVHFRNEKDVQEFAKLINQKITHKQPTLWYPYMPNSVCSHLIYSQSNKNEKIESNE